MPSSLSDWPTASSKCWAFAGDPEQVCHFRKARELRRRDHRHAFLPGAVDHDDLPILRDAIEQPTQVGPVGLESVIEHPGEEVCQIEF